MRAIVVTLVLLGGLAGCGMPEPPDPPANPGGGGGGDDEDDDDTVEPCGECTVYDCEDDDVPDVSTEQECEDAASDLDCESWEWDPC